MYRNKKYFHFIYIFAIIVLVYSCGFSVCELNINPAIIIHNNDRGNRNREFNEIGEEFIKFNEIHLNRIVKRDLSKCPCSDQSLCNIITKPRDKEIVGFVINQPLSFYQNYVNWSSITTLAIGLNNYTDPRIICLAHQNGVRVLYRSDFPANGWNYMSQNEWIYTNVALMNQFFVDGISLDFEEHVGNINYTKELSTFVMKISNTINMVSPYLQITYCIDVGLEPIDYGFISKLIDYFIVMAYDLSWNSNPLESNSPYPVVTNGITQLLQMNIPSSQIILAVPWYGYYGQCTNPVALLNITCHTIGYQTPLSMGYNGIYTILNTLPNSGEQWDESTSTPYLNWIHNNSIYQIQYDNPISVYYKSQFAKSVGLRGVSVWALDFINTLPIGGPAVSSMWDALESFME